MRVDDLSRIRPTSSRILIVMTVLVTERARARKAESLNENPRFWAIKNTITSVPSDSASAVIIDILPTDRSLPIGNSVPVTKSSMIMPSSAKRFSVSGLCTRLNGGVNGPITMPAIM